MSGKRRDKGDGSIYRRGDGRMVGEWLDTNGRKRYVTGKNKTKPQIKAIIRKKLEERDNGIAHDSTGLTVQMYMERWLEDSRDTVGFRTYQRAEEIARLHIVPRLGTMKLDKLTTLDLDKLYRAKLNSGLSPRSVQIIHATAHKALKQAVRWQLVRSNVAKDATPPKTVHSEVQTLTKEQTKQLLQTARENQPKLYALYVLAVTTGARLGELLALKVDDIDIQHCTLRITKSVYNGRVTSPKTKSGRRTIKLPKLAHETLQDHLRASAGNTWVFQSPVNEDMSIHRATLHVRYWKPLLKLSGLPDTTFHSLRHTAASLMLCENVPLPVVSFVLGHSNPNITATIYSHMLGNMSGYGADGMDAALS